MYHRLNDQWASTLLAFIALACCAIPYVFYFFGARIRRYSKYAYVDPDETPTSTTFEKSKMDVEKAAH